MMMQISDHAQTWNEKFEVIVQGIEITGTITSCSPSKNMPVVCIPALVATQEIPSKPVPARTKL